MVSTFSYGCRCRQWFHGVIAVCNVKPLSEWLHRFKSDKLLCVLKFRRSPLDFWFWLRTHKTHKSHWNSGESSKNIDVFYFSNMEKLIFFGFPHKNFPIFPSRLLRKMSAATEMPQQCFISGSCHCHCHCHSHTHSPEATEWWKYAHMCVHTCVRACVCVSQRQFSNIHFVLRFCHINIKSSHI